MICVAALAVGAAACSSSDKKSSSSSSSSNAAAATTGDTITIKNFTFTNISVKAGTKVTVKNDDSTTHTVTADKNEFDTGNIEGGSSGSFTAPSTPGTYGFHCNIHQTTMKGTLTVT